MKREEIIQSESRFTAEMSRKTSKTGKIWVKRRLRFENAIET